MKIFFIIAVTVRDAFLYNEIVVLRPKVESEQKAKGMMAQGFKMTDSQWEYAYRCFELMNLDILAHLFSADGVLKRGS